MQRGPVSVQLLAAPGHLSIGNVLGNVLIFKLKFAIVIVLFAAVVVTKLHSILIRNKTITYGLNGYNRAIIELVKVLKYLC